MAEVPREDGAPLASVYLRTLLHINLATSLAYLAPFFVVALGLPILFWLKPGVADIRVIGLPLSWLLLGLVCYPGLAILGYMYMRSAETTEEEFSDLVERP